MEYKSLENLEVYKMGVELSNYARNIYKQRDYFINKIIGDQFIRAIDSIGANIAEGFGRFYYLDSVRFYYNARGSLFESKHRVKLLLKREYITKTHNEYLIKNLDVLGVKLNNFIKYIKEKNK